MSKDDPADENAVHANFISMEVAAAEIIEVGDLLSPRRAPRTGALAAVSALHAHEGCAGAASRAGACGCVEGGGSR